MAYLRILLPLTLISFLVVYIIKLCKKDKEKEYIFEDGSFEKKKTKEDGYMAEGMAIGFTFGTSIGILFNGENIGVFAGVGMLLGMVIGIKIKKY